MVTQWLMTIMWILLMSQHATCFLFPCNPTTSASGGCFKFYATWNDNSNVPMNDNNDNNNDDNGTTHKVPPNLRRKVHARRPLMGNVIPKHNRIKVSGGSSESRLYAQGKPRAPNWNNPSKLRILGGDVRGRKLVSPKVFLRPMMARVKEALFSSLKSFGIYQHHYRLRHLDLFAGSGSVGLESMSRGAPHVTFCDSSPDCCQAIDKNIELCGFQSPKYETNVICGDAIALLKEPYKFGIPDGETFGLVTICPPYEEVVYADLLDALVNSPLVVEDTIAVVEYPVELLGDIPHYLRGDTAATYMLGVRNRRYGRTIVATYIYNPSGDLELATSRPEEFVLKRKGIPMKGNEYMLSHF